MGSLEEVLEFWFGTPATTVPELTAKLHAWFIGTPARDREIATRFGRRVEQAVRGELDFWAITVEGRLALVLLLDQMTRTLWRGTARAWAGDLRAQRLAKEAFDVRAHVGLGPIEQLFLAMPFSHAESSELRQRAVTLGRQAIATAPAWQQPFLREEIGVPLEFRGQALPRKAS